MKERIRTHLSMKCHYCEQEKEGLPFRCNYCGYLYCGDHRLPENHACPRVGGPAQPGYAKLSSTGGEYSKEKRNLPVIRPRRPRFGLRYSGLFSANESRHILVATGLMVLVGLSMVFGVIFTSPYLLLIALPLFALSFLGHELSHKILAQRNGLWAQFQTNVYGLMLTAISIILPFKFLAPGQVNIQGSGNKEVLGAIGLVGPGFNLVLGFLLYLVVRILPFSSLVFVLTSVAQFNGWLAVINLIPFGSLDGTRVFEWDRTRWAIALVASIALLILSSYFWH